MISWREVNTVVTSLMHFRRGRAVEMSCRSKTIVQTIVDAVATDFWLLFPLSPCVHGNRIPERHDVTRRKEAAKRKRLISPSSTARALLSEEPAL